MNPGNTQAPQGRQFDFLIGRWQIHATRHQPDGSQVAYEARWTAAKLADGKMVMDEFTALAPDRRALSSYVTLRTYCEATGRWEMTGLAASQPAMPMQWHGLWEEGEMRLEASGTDPRGQVVLTRIRFFDIGESSFRWDSHASSDGGRTWGLTASLVASRAG